MFWGNSATPERLPPRPNQLTWQSPIRVLPRWDDGMMEAFWGTAIYRYTLLLMEGNHANPLRLVFDSIICRVLYIPGGAGFLSSTGFTLLKTHRNKLRRFPHRPINGNQMLIDPFGRNENITLNTSKQSMTLCKISQGS